MLRLNWVIRWVQGSNFTQVRSIHQCGSVTVCASILEHLQHLALPCLEEGWYMQDGLLHNAGDWIVVPDDVSLHTEIIQLTHDVPHVGHPRIEKTIELLGRSYHWPSI
jgi:hypothetical protein